MSDKIQDVARAIYESRNGHGCRPWSLLPKAHKAPYLDDARAAIEAMRDYRNLVDAALAGKGEA